MEEHRQVDDPRVFEFHDSVFELDRADENDIAVWVRGLNIFRDAHRTAKRYDLEIKKAHILFCGISGFTYDPGRTWGTDERGASVPTGPEIIYHGKEAVDRFKEDLREGATIYSDTIVDGDRYKIYGCGNEPFFEITFRSRSVVIEWDGYRGPAWYESTRQFSRASLLDTPDGETSVTERCILRYDPDELYRADGLDEIDPKEITVGVRYGGKEYRGRGSDSSGKDAFEDLGRQLPEGVTLKRRSLQAARPDP